MNERAPSEFEISLVDKATYLRGKIITSYAQVEFLLADISVRLDLKFPYLIKDRIKAAKRLHERAGFEIYKEDIERVCDDLLQYDDLRNFMAHGFLLLTTDRLGNHEFEMRRYQRYDAGQFTEIEIKTTIPRLTLAADHITEYVKRAVSVFQRIYLEQGLENVSPKAQRDPNV